MADLLTDILLEDHKRVRELCKEMRSSCLSRGDEADEKMCFETFRKLKALTQAHIRAEEYTVYAMFEEDEDENLASLRRAVLEGYEEHDLVDLLLKQMGQVEEVTPQWRAKLAVLADLLDWHMEREESQLLLKARDTIGPEEAHDLGIVYMRERDEIFSKRQGRRRPLSLESLPPVSSGTNR
ncbi:MAG: hemerythrin domain-containing protein [Bdellovibrionales bacterium]